MIKKIFDEYGLQIIFGIAISMGIFALLMIYAEELADCKINEYNQIESQIKHTETIIEGIQSANERAKSKLKTSKELNFNDNKTFYFSQFSEKNVKDI